MPGNQIKISALICSHILDMPSFQKAVLIYLYPERGQMAEGDLEFGLLLAGVIGVPLNQILPTSRFAYFVIGT